MKECREGDDEIMKYYSSHEFFEEGKKFFLVRFFRSAVQDLPVLAEGAAEIASAQKHGAGNASRVVD